MKSRNRFTRIYKSVAVLKRCVDPLESFTYFGR
jgi:hypothetical protein